jgi:hypothetical protein
METKPNPSGNQAIGNPVDVLVQADSTIAPFVYWVTTTIAVLIGCGGPAILVLERSENEPWSDTVLVSLVAVIVAVLLYFIGWGWRWLYTRRRDHLFAKVKYTSDRLEPTRAKWAGLLSVVSLGV